MIPFFPDLSLAADFEYSYFGTIASNTTTNGDAVDCINHESSTHLLYVTGDVGDATTDVTLKLQESDTSGGTYSDITGASVDLGASATASDKKSGVLRVPNRQKRYVRGVIVTSGGSSISVPIAVGIIGRKKIAGGSSVKTTVP